MDTSLLEEMGFTKGEIAVYFALLEFGETTIGPLSRKAGITPAKTYPILDRLARKGLATHVMKSDTKHFQAFEPERLLDYLEERKQRIEEQERRVETLIPQLLARRERATEQYAETYEGVQGMRSLYDRALRHLGESGEDFIGFTLPDRESYARADLFFKQYDTRRRGRGIKTLLLGREDQRSYVDGDGTLLQVRFVPHGLPTGVIIFGDAVATLVWKGVPRAFVIHSPETAQAYRKFFWDLWEAAG